jgi:hypothetical protein
VKKTLCLAFALFFSSAAFASVVQVEAGSQAIEGVNIAKAATVNAGGATLHLSALGAGLRSKHVVITNVKVYVVEVFADKPELFNRNPGAALDSLMQMQSVAIHLSFLRSVDAPTVQSSFRDSLTANGVDLQRPDVAAFLTAVNTSGDAQSGGSLNIIAKNEGGAETVVYEDTAGRATTIKGTTGLVRAIFSIWFGQSADSGLATLKTQLLQPVQP